MQNYCVISLNIKIAPRMFIFLLIPFYSWENGDSERVSHTAKNWPNQTNSCCPNGPHTIQGVGKLWPEGQIQPTTHFVKQSFTRTLHSSFVYLLPMTALMLWQQSWVVATETVWPAEPEIFTIWLFKEKVCLPLVQAILAKIKCLSVSDLLKGPTHRTQSTELATKTKAFPWP